MIRKVRSWLRDVMQKESVMLFSVTTALITITAAFFSDNEGLAVRGPFPLADPEASIGWEIGPKGPELVLRAVAHMTPGVACDYRALITRYWDVGGALIVAWPNKAVGRPSGPFYAIDKMREGDVGEVRFPADEVPEGARDYVTMLTAPIGSCGIGGWWGAAESVRLAIPPRPDFRP